MRFTFVAVMDVDGGVSVAQGVAIGLSDGCPFGAMSSCAYAARSQQYTRQNPDILVSLCIKWQLGNTINNVQQLVE